MTVWIVRSERTSKWGNILVAVAVAYICTIAVTMWYEQIYANLWDLANHSTYWLIFYTFPPKMFQVIVDMSLVFVALPWMRRSNIKLVVLFSLITIGCFLAWFDTGFGFPASSELAYSLNGGSRIASQLAMALAVYPRLNNQSTVKFAGALVSGKYSSA